MNEPIRQPLTAGQLISILVGIALIVGVIFAVVTTANDSTAARKTACSHDQFIGSPMPDYCTSLGY